MESELGLVFKGINSHDTSPKVQAAGADLAVTSSHCEDMTHFESNNLVRSMTSQFDKKSLSGGNM